MSTPGTAAVQPSPSEPNAPLGHGMAPQAAAPMVVQLVPHGEGGVRDFADALAEVWQRWGTTSPRLPLGQAEASAQALHLRLAGWVGPAGSAQDRAVLPVLVHYSGYGYHRRGLCGWLARELANVRRHHPIRITVLFHELHASGPPWRSAFWLGGLQARAARQVVAQADALWTNTEAHAAWLTRCIDTRRDLTPVVRPVFSNVGEPASPPPLAARPGKLLVFGSQASRQRVALALRRDRAVLDQLALTDVIEAGTGRSTLTPTAGLPVRFAGALSQTEMSDLLLQCRFGLIDYPDDLLAKSSVFAAYAAHGCSVINLRHGHPGHGTGHGASTADGLSAGKHYLAASSAPGLAAQAAAMTGAPASASNAAALQAMADATRAWYGQHALVSQAAKLLRLASP